MSEQQSGAGYPQQPTSGQPQQQAYGQQPQYASPQAQYQAQQQYAGYAPAGPSLFERLGVPSMPAILGISGLGALVLSGLIAGTSDGTTLSEYIGGHFGGGFFDSSMLLVGLIVMFGLTLFAGERLRPLWKTLVLAAGALFLAQFLFVVLGLPDSSSGSDASAWIGAILLLGAYGVFIAGALMVPASAEAAAQAQAAKAQQAQAAQQAAQQQQQQPGAYGTGQQQTQQGQWPQAPQG